jgi:hypothetical protein
MRVKLLSVILLFSFVLAFSGCGQKENEASRIGLTMYGTAGDQETKYNHLINKEVSTIGFKLSDPHARVNDGYKEKYGKTYLDNLGFFSVANNEKIRTMLEKFPALGVISNI